MTSIFACGKIPAFAQSTSMPPKRSATRCIAASSDASSVTSAATAMAPWPISPRQPRPGKAAGEDRDPRAGLREDPGDALADTFRAAGDDDRAAGDGMCHILASPSENAMKSAEPMTWQ